MNDIDGKLWAAFEVFAAKYPDDPGARMTLEVARWVREHQTLLEKKLAQNNAETMPGVATGSPARIES